MKATAIARAGGGKWDQEFFLDAQTKTAHFQFQFTDESLKLWSPENPQLYDLKVEIKNVNKKVVDTVDSYFAMRHVEIRREEDSKGGHNRIFLNGEPYFMLGTLDQGWWPDGLYTAPSDD